MCQIYKATKLEVVRQNRNLRIAVKDYIMPVVKAATTQVSSVTSSQISTICTFDGTGTYSALPMYHISGRTDDDEPQPSIDGDGRLKQALMEVLVAPSTTTEETQRKSTGGTSGGAEGYDQDGC